jgi:hypothetical protein
MAILCTVRSCPPSRPPRRRSACWRRVPAPPALPGLPKTKEKRKSLRPLLPQRLRAIPTPIHLIAPPRGFVLRLFPSRLRNAPAHMDRGKGRRRGERRRQIWAPRLRNRCFSPRPHSWRPQKKRTARGQFAFFCLFPLSFSFVVSLVRYPSTWDRPGRRAKGSLQRAAFGRTAAGKRSKMYAAIVYIG